MKSNLKSPKNKIFDNIEKLSFKDRTQISCAIRSHSEQKLISIKQGKYIKIIPKKVRKDIKKFNQDHNKVFKHYKIIKTENDNFSTKYKNFYTSKENKDKNFLFNDLISKYHEKGYKAIDINIELFEPSALLLETNKIFDFSKLVDNLRSYEKDQFYLEKLNKVVQDKLSSDSKKSTLSTKKTDTKSLTVPKTQSDLSKLNLNKKTDSNNQIDLLLENDILKRTIESNGFIKKMHSGATEISRNKNIRTSLMHYIENQTSDNRIYSDTKNQQSFSQPYKIQTGSSSIMNQSPDIVSKKASNFLKKPKLKKIEKNNMKPISPSLNRKISSFNIDMLNMMNERDKANKDIEDKLKNHFSPELDNIYEMSKSKDHDFRKTVDFLMKTTGKNKSGFVEGMRTKLDPNEIVKSITETKNIVNSVNIYETHKNFISKLGLFNINKENLNNIR